jgi:hypothetical protein
MLVPRVVAKDLAQSEPGELVRTSGRNGPILGLIAKWHITSDAKLLICLTPPDEQNPGPCYMQIAPRSGTALSFGRDYVIVGDTGTEAVDSRWYGDFYAAGALIVAGERTLLQVAPMRHSYQCGDAFYDIDAGSTVGDVTAPGCVLLKWEIRLKPILELDPPLPPIFRFETRSRSGG